MSSTNTTAGICEVCGGKCQPQNATCRPCGIARGDAHTKLKHTTQQARLTAPQRLTVQTPQRLALGFVCRPHYMPVNARGKGCQQCAADLAPEQKKHTPARPSFLPHESE